METPVAMAATPAPARSKQKNCNGCVVAKRRCDRRAPTCSRCAEKMIPCTWGKPRRLAPPSGPAPVALAEGAEEEGGTADTQMTTGEDGTVSPLLLVPSAADDILIGTPSVCPLFPHVVFRRPPSGADAHYPLLEPMDTAPFGSPEAGVGGGWPQASVLDAPVNDTSMRLFDDLMTSDTSRIDQWAVQLTQGPLAETERPGTPLNEDVAETYRTMAGFCTRLEPWHMYDPKQRLHFITNSLKNFVTDVANRGASPFLHRHLYKDYTPPCIVSCFSTCVLYKNRTPDNAAMVVRAIQSDVKGLVGSESDANTGAVSQAVLMPLEKVARVQALLLYQIIRLLDGDVMLRAQGERDMELMEGWVRDLCKVRDNLGNLEREESGRVRTGPPEEWERWILAESVRRTILITQSFSKLYQMMHETPSTDYQNSFWLHAHRWTLSKYLWEADSSYEFIRMWKEKPQFVITGYKFEQFLEHGKGDDADEFSRILLTMFMGVDEAKEFFSERK